MIGYEDMTKAWWLTRGMARISGLNLPHAVVEGWLPRSEVRSLITRCDACQSGRHCEAWLASSARARAMPDFCPNKAAIEALVA